MSVFGRGFGKTETDEKIISRNQNKASLRNQNMQSILINTNILNISSFKGINAIILIFQHSIERLYIIAD